MSTVLQVLGGVLTAAILAAIGYIIRLEKRMDKLENAKVQTGEKGLPKRDAEEFWDAKHDGYRRISVPVVFPETFKSQPTVMVALKRFDLGDFKSNIHRIGVRAENPTTKGFDLYFETWYESLVFDAVVSWVAFVE